jgi:L-ascorbate metabolism protein UlaG (beta-lactamase superfamily)
MIENLLWYGHACFCLDTTPRILIDPWSILYDGPPPDVILVSHEDYDHCSPADINKLRGPNTMVIASKSAAESLDGDVKVLRPWQVINIGRTSIKAVSAYTFDGRHPAYREDLGFVISQNYTDLYYAGDTDFIPELRNLRCDIAVLPVSARDGSVSLNSSREFVEQLKPRYVVPSHLGRHPSSGGTLELQAFQREISPLTDVVVLPQANKVGTGSLFARI